MSAPTSSVISCRRVTRRYEQPGRPPVVAVADVDLEVAAGEFMAVEGPSGSGKTTLLGLIAGLEPPSEGAITLLGHDLGRLTPKERARLRQSRLGIVFQTFGLVASLSAGDNVGLPLLLAGVEEAERIARVRSTLEEVGLGALETARVDELSGGERQRVGAARALVNDPAIILADEPTGSLDEGTGGIVLELLVAAVRRRGASLVLVTHDTASAARADRHLRMRDGRILDGASR
jgi:ABC-type lipoprotein export system ATPase subunit